MLRVGFARREITPGRDCSLFGFGFRQEAGLAPGNDGVHDPLYVRALVLHDDEAPAAIISFDLCVLETELARALRDDCAALLGVKPDRIILACTHTHHGPLPQLRPDSASETDRHNHEYGVFLRESLREVVTLARGLLYPARIGVRTIPCALGYERRIPLGTTVQHCWNPHEQPHLRPPAATDPILTTVIFEQTGGPRRWILWNAGVHPVVLGKTYNHVSADYPGIACAMLERNCPDTEALFTLGAAGDNHPWIATQDRPTRLEPVARAAAAMVELVAHGTIPEIMPATVQTAATTMEMGGHAHDLTVWSLGNLKVAAVPGELFGGLAEDLRERVEGGLLLITCANGWTGYWPTAQAFEQGGYEVENAIGGQINPGDGERLTVALAAMLESL